MAKKKTTVKKRLSSCDREIGSRYIATRVKLAKLRAEAQAKREENIKKTQSPTT